MLPVAPKCIYLMTHRDPNPSALVAQCVVKLTEVTNIKRCEIPWRDHDHDPEKWECDKREFLALINARGWDTEEFTVKCDC